MQLRHAGLIVLALALGAGCRAPGLDPTIATTWLDGKKDVPALDVSGAWESTANYLAGGWGSGVWIQKGAQVTGTLGPYTIEGRVSGKKLYLLILTDGRVHYTAVIEGTADGALLGTAVRKELADADTAEARLADKAPISLVRPARP